MKDKKTHIEKYQPSKIEDKWQAVWEKEKLYASDLSKQNKYYVLAEFAYPSGDLHMGHWFTWAGADVFARFKRLQGFQVFFPNGFDAFGLPAENAAIKRNIHPQDWTLSNVEKMKKQYKTMGATFTFDHEVITCLPDYYRWNQWIFIQMYKKGLAYIGKKLSNWCPVDQTVLANEGLEDGKCWRCGSVVEQKEIAQWFFKLTDYADKLIWPSMEGKIDATKQGQVDWPKAVKDAQNQWIGKSEGMEIEFKVENAESKITVYTVYPETIFGVTYLVVAPEHSIVAKLLNSEFKIQNAELQAVKEYVANARKKTEEERKVGEKDKTGVFTGLFITNPVNGQNVPIWVADYVIGSYGTGAVMGVPGSDHRDFAFAKKYQLPIIRVIGKTKDDTSPIHSEEDVLEEGILVNSTEFSGLATPQPAREKIKDWLTQKGFGRRKKQYHIHDWSISRQRYWDTPVPMIHCDNCGIVPVPEKDLPVELPYDVDYTPKGKAPLASNEKWLQVKCPKCRGNAKRDAETMDTFVDSSWYFFRYLSPKDQKAVFDKAIAEKIMPVDIYFGGAEHTLGHTLYSRFFTKFFKDIGLTDLDEYANRRISHGIILGPDGAKMSKSKGNVVNPDEEVKKYGADTIRTYLSFFIPYEGTGPWISDRVYSMYRFLQRVWDLQGKISNIKSQISKNQMDRESLIKMNQTIAKVSKDMETINFNTALAAIMEWLNYLSKKEEVTEEEYKNLLIMLAPFAPHMTEEIFQNFKSQTSHLENKEGFVSIHSQKWPEAEKEYLVADEMTIAVQINGKTRDTILIQNSESKIQKTVEEKAKESTKIQGYLNGKEIRKVIHVAGKIVNFVV